jgi:hypothetical protein
MLGRVWVGGGPRGWRKETNSYIIVMEEDALLLLDLQDVIAAKFKSLDYAIFIFIYSLLYQARIPVS